MRYDDSLSSGGRWVSVLFFWLTLCLSTLGFLVESQWVALVCWVFIVPLFFGTHEALHGSLLPEKGFFARGRRTHNMILLWLGYSLQGMNFLLLKPAHLHHHAYGRYAEGYAPDVFPGPVRLRDRVLYYVTLLGLPAVLWQIAGLLCVVIPLRRIPILVDHRWFKKFRWWQYLLTQVGPVAFFGLMISIAGPCRVLLYEAVFVLIWGLLQNAAHYGIKGYDAASDRVCAYSYYLGPVGRLFTFGATAHLAHHVDMSLPGICLHTLAVETEIEKKIGVKIRKKFGAGSFFGDIFRQLKGPVTLEDLITDWCECAPPESNSGRTFGYRRGRE